MAVQLLRRKFTIAEYYQMAEAGIFLANDRVELIAGEIIEMSPIGSRHAAGTIRLTRLFSRLIGDRAFLSVQNPIRLSDRSEPQPDLTLLQLRPDFYAQGHPQPAEVLLLVEVSDTTVEYDREVKIPLYAQAGIVEVWLVNLPEEYIAVYRHPAGDRYLEIQRWQRGQNISILAFPDVSLAVNDVFV